MYKVTVKVGASSWSMVNSASAFTARGVWSAERDWSAPLPPWEPFFYFRWEVREGEQSIWPHSIPGENLKIIASHLFWTPERNYGISHVTRELWLILHMRSTSETRRLGGKHAFSQWVLHTRTRLSESVSCQILYIQCSAQATLASWKMLSTRRLYRIAELPHIPLIIVPFQSGLQA